MAKIDRTRLISEVVRKLSREEMDLVVEHISSRVESGDIKEDPNSTDNVKNLEVADLPDSGESVCHSSSSFRYMLSLLVNKQCHQVRKGFIAFLLDDIA